MYTHPAKAAPFEGAPRITAPSVFGASPNKPFLWRVPVLGERPVSIEAEGLPEGLRLEGNTVRGFTSRRGEFPVTLRAVNAKGSGEKTVTLRLEPDGMLRTPLLGFTTWNAFQTGVTQEDVIRTGELLVEKGIAEYGYSYVNLDSSWQGEYGGRYNAIMPCERFPDMGAMYARLHELGLKGGIYSSPFLQPWGCPPDRESLPGCTVGEPDIRFPDRNTGIGVDRREAENVAQWTEWGVDYLKYDWMPTDAVNADLMKRELLKAGREIAFCVTVHADPACWRYWVKNCCSWRSNDDTYDTWDNLYKRFSYLNRFEGRTAPGHFYDLDMLAIGAMIMNNLSCRYTPEEELTAYTLHAFFPSPVQLSMQLDRLTDYEFDLICNEELIAINQDALGDYPKLVFDEGDVKIYSRSLEDGGKAYAVFNLSEKEVEGSLELGGEYALRRVWEEEDIGVSDRLSYILSPHESAVFRLSPVK